MNILSPASPTEDKLDYLIVDTGAFIRNTRLDLLSQNIYTTEGVAKEIRDEISRKNTSLMINLPNIRQPGSTYIQRVRKFAELSGDLKQLSPTDIQVIALTLMLTEEHGDASTIRSVPPPFTLDVKHPNNSSWSPHEEKSASLIGSNIPLENEKPQQGTSSENSNSINHDLHSTHTNEDDVHTPEIPSNSFNDFADEEGWITAENLHRLGQGSISINHLLVACLTTDYTLQNVLIKMGLNIISIDGYQITHTKQWITKCVGCHHIDTDANLLFCARCGNNSLSRLSVTTDMYGNSYIHKSKGKKNLRGTIYSMPKPSNKKDLILTEDQLFMGGRDRELRYKTKLWEKSIADNDPFRDGSIINQQGKWHRNYTHSGQLEIRGAPKIVIGLGKGNPNSNRWMKKHKPKK